MDLKRWSHIVAVADRRSFARAAELVHLSQPALSRSIQAAESELGLRLFDRGTQSVTPTPAGEFVVARARQLVFNSRCLERDVELYANRGLGDTAFGAGPFPAATFVPALLAGLRRDYPGVALRVEVGNWQSLLQALRAEDIEFFVADSRDLPLDPLIKVSPLRPEPGGFYVRAGHPLARRKTVTLAEMWGHGVASVRLPQAVRSALARLLGIAAAVDLSIALECDDVELLKAAALDSDLVLGAPHAAVERDVDRRSLKALAVVDLPPLSSSMGVVTLRGRTPSPMADLAIRRLPSAGAGSSRRSASRQGRPASGTLRP